jgi:hypothetical protein
MDIRLMRIIDDKLITIIHLTFNRARIVIGPIDLPYYDDGW